MDGVINLENLGTVTKLKIFLTVRNFQLVFWIKWNRFGRPRFCAITIREGAGDTSWLVGFILMENIVEV